MISFKHFLAELRARHVRKTMAIYTSSGLTAVGLVKLFTDVYDLPPLIFSIVVVLLTCGFGSAFVIAWYHGAGGTQKTHKGEILLHSIFLAAAIVASFHITRSPYRVVRTHDTKSIAVLPFKNMSDSKEDEYFSDGITEDIITQLSKISDLKVISRTSVMQYKLKMKNLREIGSELDVATILEGSVRRAADRVRIVGQLIDARDDKHLWAETYDRELKDIFAIQSEVARDIAAALQARLSPGEIQQIGKSSTQNLDAYGFYLRGRDYYYRYTKEDNERAVELFHKALALDPKYALAYAGLGDAYERRSSYDTTWFWLDSSVVVSNVAISFDPTLAEGYKALGGAYQTKGQLRRALEYYQKAIELNPNYAPVVSNIGHVNYVIGAYDEALKWMKKAAALQPGFARWSSNVAVQYFSLGYDSLASAWFRKALDLQPDFFFPYIVLSYIHLYGGKYDLARESIQHVLAQQSENYSALDAAGDVELIGGNYQQAKHYYELATAQSSLNDVAGNKLAYVLARLGQQKEATKIVAENFSAFAHSPYKLDEGSSIPYCTAEIYSMQGKADHALEWLQKAIDRGYRDYRWVAIDPLLDNVRNQVEFSRIMSDLNRKIQEMRKHVEEQTQVASIP
jgi:adenylate cyclase